MANIIELNCFGDERGYLTVIEKEIGFPIKRVYYIYNTNSEPRGGHRHKKTTQALICVSGSCEVYSNNSKEEDTFLLDKPTKCLIVEKEDWHIMKNFSENCVLLVLASEFYDINDYIDEKY